LTISLRPAADVAAAADGTGFIGLNFDDFIHFVSVFQMERI
jgi:hypothetical protein